MQKIIKLYKYFSDKRYSTIAGTLVYFLIMSITPFMLWLTLLVGNIDIESVVSNRMFAAVSPAIGYFSRSAESAAGGAGIILLATSLYSSTNFFYHLRRSGEIIYDCDRAKGGLRLRLASGALVVGSIIAFAVVAALLVSGEKLLNRVLSSTMSRIITDLIVVFAALCVATLLNLFACPYKIKLSQVLPGSFLTSALWLVFAVGFTVYLHLANPSRLYGRIASLIIFFIWCYIMTNCLVIGFIYNGRFLTEKKRKSLF